MLGLDRESVFLEVDFDCNSVGFNYDMVIKNLIIRNIKGKKIGFEFYRKLILGGYYYKVFNYNNELVCLYDVIRDCILKNDLSYFNNDVFKVDFEKCILKFVMNNILVVDDSNIVLENFISDINLSYNNELKRVDKIKSVCGINFNNEYWEKVLISKEKYDEKREMFVREIFVNNLYKWGIIDSGDNDNLINICNQIK
jgi:hypothetical protein